MIARHARQARTAFVIAVVAFGIGFAPNTIAQDARDVPWWHELQMPDAATQSSLLHDTRTTPASSFDPTLPAISLEEWLWLTLAPAVQFSRPQLVEWRLSPCLDQHSAIPGPGPELCAEGTVPLSAERQVQIVIALAEAVRSSSTGVPQWRPVRPSLRDVFIERLKDSARIDSLDVLTLGALPRLLNTPFDQWPAVDFETTISWEPRNPAPGDMVRFSISVRNTGKRSVDRVRIEIVISPCCSNTEVRQEWFPPIAAGQAVRVDGTVPLPEGRAMASIAVSPWQGYKKIRESNPDKLPTQALVGYPPRPPLKAGPGGA